MKFIDIHSHLGFEDYGADQTEVLKRMKDLEVATIAVGSNYANSKDALQVAKENDDVFACVGIHPDDGHGQPFDESDFEILVTSPKVVAIGECGLDYFSLSQKFEQGLSLRRSVATGKGESLDEFISIEKSRQKSEFQKQIAFALKHNKPLMLHLRDGEVKGEAYEDAYNLLKTFAGQVRGNLHFFAGSLDWARKFIELGFTISFTGVITFARNYDEVIKNVPLSALQAETDAPFVAPIPYRGKRNEPVYVIEVYKKLAEIRGESLETVRLALLENARRVFDL